MQDYKLSNYTTCCAELNTIYLSSDKNVVEGFRCTNRGEEYIDRSDISNSIWIHGDHSCFLRHLQSRFLPEKIVFLHKPNQWKPPRSHRDILFQNPINSDIHRNHCFFLTACKLPKEFRCCPDNHTSLVTYSVC